MQILSKIMVYGLDESICASAYPMATELLSYKIDGNDYKRAHVLGCADIGSGHDNFLNGIIMQADWTLPVKVWTEAQRYHFLDFVSSQSTMHRISRFDIDNAYSEYTDRRMIGVMSKLIDSYNNLDDPEAKAEAYLRILYSNPCGFKLTARMTTNYRQLKTIYRQRCTHRLPEWREVCREFLELPGFTKLTGCGNDK